MSSAGEEVSNALAAVERLYSTGLTEHGARPRAVGWRDGSSQQLRFAKLAQLLPRTGAGPITVNDLGCGYGSLFGFLDAMDGVDLVGYYGYDISEPMLVQARQATDARAEFLLSSEPIRDADYSFASGPFNVKGGCSDAAWQTYVREAVLRLAEKSRRGFAFNLMTTFVDFRVEELFYADPCAFFEFCKREISPDVTLVHDYPLFEWTMLVHHRDAGPARPAPRAARSPGEAA